MVSEVAAPIPDPAMASASLEKNTMAGVTASESESQPEKVDGAGSPSSEKEAVYPSGLVLAVIVAALFLAVFLFALDMVRIGLHLLWIRA